MEEAALVRHLSQVWNRSQIIPMSWAKFAIEALKRGETVQIRFFCAPPNRQKPRILPYLVEHFSQSVLVKVFTLYFGVFGCKKVIANGADSRKLVGSFNNL